MGTVDAGSKERQPRRHATRRWRLAQRVDKVPGEPAPFSAYPSRAHTSPERTQSVKRRISDMPSDVVPRHICTTSQALAQSPLPQPTSALARQSYCLPEPAWLNATGVGYLSNRDHAIGRCHCAPRGQAKLPCGMPQRCRPAAPWSTRVEPGEVDLHVDDVRRQSHQCPVGWLFLSPIRRPCLP